LLSNAGGFWSLTGNAGTNPANNFLGTTDNQPLVFRTNNSERVRIDTNGRVGIGTTSPEMPLHIVGNSGLLIQRADTSGLANVYFRTGTDNNVMASIGFTSGGTNDLILRTGGLYERMRITSTGNVGIGTTTPTTKLEVEGSGDTQIRIDSTAGTASSVLELASGANTNYIFTGSDGHLYARTDDTNRHVLLQAGSASGNVGIGTTAPTNKLHVLSSNYFPAKFEDSGSSIIQIQAGGTNHWAEIDLKSTYNVADNKVWNLAARGLGGFVIRQLNDARTSGTERLVIDTNGNVGIGTTTPATKLEVEGSGDTRIRIDSTAGTASSVLELASGTKTNYIFTGSDGHLYARTNDTNRHVLLQAGLASGNVGIGTWAPSEKLHVVGNFMLVNNGASIAYKDGSLTWSNPSDARLKTNIQPITNALEKITKLRGVSFDWVNQDLHQGDAKSGFLAQEMEQVFPDCVQEIEVDSNSPDAKLVGDGKIKTVGLTTGFFASMVEAIKEQQQMIEQQTELIEQQQQKLEQQEQLIAEQQKIIAEQQAKLAILEQKYSELESKLNKLG